MLNTTAVRFGRLGWIDAVRGCAVVLVVFFHSGTLMRYSGQETPPSLIAMNDLAAPFRMPTLVFLSGLFVAGSLRKGAAVYAIGKLRMIAWPYLVWLTFFFVLSTPVYNPMTFVLGGTWLWFLAFLVIFYAAAWALQRIPTGIVVTTALAASVLAPDGTKWGERLLLLFAFFMAGHWMTTHDQAWTRLMTSRWSLGTAALLIIAFAFMAFSGLVGGAGGYDPVISWASAAGLVLVLRAARRFAEAPWAASLRWAGRHSLIFYVTHFPVIYAAAHVLEGTGAADAVGQWGTYGILASAALGAAAVCGAVIEREPRPLTAWLFRWAAIRSRPRARPVAGVPASSLDEVTSPRG